MTFALSNTSIAVTLTAPQDDWKRPLDLALRTQWLGLGTFLKMGEELFQTSNTEDEERQ
mgnify:CR=1 FL=1